ncbi:hypothetical protein BCR36DRAFT_373173 [Piromyces finnis]|uniref:Uncharacterized protein n=1 Tax=Piromyces finnis TaxID=1754191 RepID=A0A1Y1V113_9FUNG|nr:hypothetical protein BCR36DRAFT_373173 [Piromyces finnis]|eukprot:ORX44698.1 hypothetical protein BCR36DRAFT_373173 [Piromyces finnis]
MLKKKGNNNIENKDNSFIITESNEKKINNEPNKLPYSVIAAYDGLFLGKNDMDTIYSELKDLKANIKRNNMENIKTLLSSKLNIDLPTTRKYQLEHLTIPYTNDQITSIEVDDERKRNMIILQYYLDII